MTTPPDTTNRPELLSVPWIVPDEPPALSIVQPAEPPIPPAEPAPDAHHHGALHRFVMRYGIATASIVLWLAICTYWTFLPDRATSPWRFAVAVASLQLLAGVISAFPEPQDPDRWNWSSAPLGQCTPGRYTITRGRQ